jgi:hypothetical protein
MPHAPAPAGAALKGCARSTIPTKANHPKGIHPIRPAAGQLLPESPRPCLGCIRVAATQDIIATESVTATMANHMSTSMIEDEQTRRVAVACLGQKATESRHARGLRRRTFRGDARARARVLADIEPAEIV